MDWTHKTFRQSAIFKGLPSSVLEAARASVAETFGTIEDTPDGFVARGRSGWRDAQATFQITPAAAGTQVAVALRVRRAAGRGYMLVDIGGYYDGQIDRWFGAIAQRLGGAPAEALVNKTTGSVALRRGCLAGCLVYLVGGACLSTFAIPLDHALFPQPGGGSLGPFTALASGIGLAAGVGVMLYVIRGRNPKS
jgi:hypothetical protein